MRRSPALAVLTVIAASMAKFDIARIHAEVLQSQQARSSEMATVNRALEEQYQGLVRSLAEMVDARCPERRRIRGTCRTLLRAESGSSSRCR